MVKTFCDICGKEIISFSRYYQIKISSNSNVVPNKYNYSANDICEDCANSIYHYIKGLQKEDNK